MQRFIPGLLLFLLLPACQEAHPPLRKAPPTDTIAAAWSADEKGENYEEKGTPAADEKGESVDEERGEPTDEEKGDPADDGQGDGDTPHQSESPAQSVDQLQVLREAVAPFLLAEEPAATPMEKESGRFGRKLFFDNRFSLNGEISCATCHQPDLVFTDGLPRSVGLEQLPFNAPTVVNTRFSQWLFWNGRKNSLDSQSVAPIEAHAEQGISRGSLAQIMFHHYRSEYEAIFGPFPPVLVSLFNTMGNTRLHALPASLRVEMPADVAAFALETLRSDDLRQELENAAAAAGRTPVEQMAIVSDTGQHPPGWVASYEGLTAVQRQALDGVLINWGKAVARYQRNLVAVDSPFDRFAQKLQTAPTVRAAYVDGFGLREKRGFDLFTGKARCHFCHAGPAFTDNNFHNIGFGTFAAIQPGRAAGVELARRDPINCPEESLGNPAFSVCSELAGLENSMGLVGAFRTPSLRNVAATAPYMHDGSLADLATVIQRYNRLDTEPLIGNRNPFMAPLGLTEGEAEDLRSFLHSLNSAVRDLSL